MASPAGLLLPGNRDTESYGFPYVEFCPLGTQENECTDATPAHLGNLADKVRALPQNEAALLVSAADIAVR